MKEIQKSKLAREQVKGKRKEDVKLGENNVKIEEKWCKFLVLDLSHNSFNNSILSTLGELTSLKSLYDGGDLKWKLIFADFERLFVLPYLLCRHHSRLYTYKLTIWVDQFIPILGKFIKYSWRYCLCKSHNKSKLEELDLSNNHIDNIEEVLFLFSKLKRRSYIYNSFHTTGLKSLSQSKILDLSFNNFSASSLQSLVSVRIEILDDLSLPNASSGRQQVRKSVGDHDSQDDELLGSPVQSRMRGIRVEDRLEGLINLMDIIFHVLKTDLNRAIYILYNLIFDLICYNDMVRWIETHTGLVFGLFIH
ncbi:hypothetical protein HYC85_004076 [Camellia sinensis]|uniref:Uncharacterized protein n=1 Tax=Camellia sinensis TaxID=4442 RepID=A0A7J7HX81_CAMSI|nr:hypothetical protein HYC85_004076 [Camellia sinensis]